VQPQGATKTLGAGTGQCCDKDDDRLIAIGERGKDFGHDKESENERMIMRGLVA
jgi:hypothetical protein